MICCLQVTNWTKEAKQLIKKERLTILIATASEPLQHGLHGLLNMVPRVQTINQVGDVASIQRAMAECHPALVLLDAGLSGNGVATVVRMIKTERAKIHCLVLADDVQQQQEAKSAGADVALLKGVLASELFEIVEWLLSKERPPRPTCEEGEK